MLWNACESEWVKSWERYEDVVKDVKRDKLAELDTWYRTTLRNGLHARDPTPYLTQEELVKLMEWKLKKGKWRPQLMKYVMALSDSSVQAASKAAFTALENGKLKEAVEELTVLKGVGPATASAVLATYDHNVPFMGDEALEAIASIIGPRKYTLPHYLLFAQTLQSKATALTKQSPSQTEWNAQQVQLCLYATSHDQANRNSRVDTTSKKRKADRASSRQIATKRTR